MKLLQLELKNIGPFLGQNIVFDDLNDKSKQQVTIITGENGSGKTIIIDAIRYLFYGYRRPSTERNIVKDEFDFQACLTYSRTMNGTATLIKANKLDQSGSFLTGGSVLDELLRPADGNGFLLDYWTSKLSTDSFEVNSISVPDHINLLATSLSGLHANQDVTRLIVYFDYMRSSDDPKEAELGESMYELTKKIFDISINNGHFVKVQRGNLKPVVSILGTELTLEKLSSGNLYLLQRLLSLLGKAYAIYSLSKVNVDYKGITDIPGLLIIDEAENHLHPKWQKTFLKDIISIFPNLQIIVTTHSPFIVSSIDDARIYVCESHKSGAKIIDATSIYSNKPIDEILATKLFNTSAFGSKITELLAKRKLAIQNNEKALEDELERQLLELNPQYFSFFNLEKLLKTGGINEAD